MILKTEGLCKQFGSMYALKDINFSIKKGEIHGLVGENGAGKSTLIKILTGVIPSNKGAIFIDGNEVEIHNPVQARKLGINVIHQDRNLIPTFNGIENIYLGLETEKKMLCSLDYTKMKSRITSVMEAYGISFPLEKLAKDLSPPQKTLVELTRAMMSDCKLLILDEPTAALTDKESEVLFNIIHTVQKKGTAILYITHRMDEIFQLTNTITVFKNGEHVKTVKKEDIDKNGLISLMTDKYVSNSDGFRKTEFGDTIFEVKNVSTRDHIVKDASFKVRKGEILGIFGLGGSGRTELLEAIYGYTKMKSGTVFLEGKQQALLSSSSSIKNGIVLVHEDRRGHSLIDTRSIKDNIVLSTIDSYSSFGIYNEKKEVLDSTQKVEELGIKTSGINQVIRELSGGNQQKVVFAKALMSRPKVFLCDEPTQAVDIRTRNEIHKLLRDCTDKGSSVVYVTSDLKEMLEVADTIMIMANGKTWESFPNENMTAEKVLTYCYQER